MKNYVKPRIVAILLSDYYREAGSADIQGKLVEWSDGYILTVMQYGGKRASDIRKYTVDVSAEKEISERLASVSWGTLLDIRLDNNKVVAVSVISDWSENIVAD